IAISGTAEFIVSAGVVAWLQRSNPGLLRYTAGHDLTPDLSGFTEATEKGGWISTRWRWVGVAVLMVVTPLGLLTTAEAWGEWGPETFDQTQGRTTIAAQSFGHAAPTQAPKGMSRLASVWTSPMPDYAPSFMHSEAFGYILSAFVGGGLV